MNPLSGDIFIFIGKRGNQLRLLQWDRDGYAMYVKRLEQGSFEWTGRGKLQFTAGGIDADLTGH